MATIRFLVSFTQASICTSIEASCESVSIRVRPPFSDWKCSRHSNVFTRCSRVGMIVFIGGRYLPAGRPAVS